MTTNRAIPTAVPGVALLLLVTITWCAAAGAATFTVTSTADTEDPGTLRRALLDANATPQLDTIAFGIPADQCDTAGVCEIVATTPLPEIVTPVVVDGTTQPRYGTAPPNVCAGPGAPLSPRIQIRGDVDSLFQVTDSAEATIRGLALGEASSPVRADGGGRVVVQCNLFGRSVDGSALPASSSNVCLGCSGGAASPSVIGTDGDGVDDEAEGNVFFAGVRGINVNTGGNNVIAGNVFGYVEDGLTLGGLNTGVYIRQTAPENRVGSNEDGISDAAERNVFVGTFNGVQIASRGGSGDGNRVVGNWFGVDSAGGIGNVENAIRLEHEGQDHVVARNRIENVSIGLWVRDVATTATASTGNCFVDNFTGLVHEGTASGLNATLNWWGDPSGPSNAGSGLGDAIEVTGSGSVDFDPWLTTPGPACSTGAVPDRIVVPAAVAAAGAEGSFFITDLEVNNRGSSPASFVLRWLPRDTDNSSPLAADEITLQPGATGRFADVVSSAFGLSEGIGALLVESTGSSLSVMSRTFNDSADGSFGQSLPGVPAQGLIQTGSVVRVLFMAENDDFRSNLGLVNGTELPLTVRYRLHDIDGQVLGEAQVMLPAWGTTQVNRVFAPYAPQQGAYIDVWTETPGGAFTCYGSVLDNLSSDPTTVLPD